MAKGQPRSGVLEDKSAGDSLPVPPTLLDDVAPQDASPVGRFRRRLKMCLLLPSLMCRAVITCHGQHIALFYDTVSAS
jgi:hypothetical protein